MLLQQGVTPDSYLQIATIDIFPAYLLVTSTQVQIPCRYNQAWWSSCFVASWSKVTCFGRLMFLITSETSPNLLHLLLCRLDHVIVHVGALSLAESQELVRM